MFFILFLCSARLLARPVVAQTSRLRTTLIILASMLIRRVCMDQVEPLISTIYNH